MKKRIDSLKKNEIESTMYKVTPLHIAFQLQNNKSINLILKYLSKLQYSQFHIFRRLMPNLIEYTQFAEFLKEQTFFTV